MNTKQQLDSANDMLYMAWTIIANAGEGDWQKEGTEWQRAAENWRDEWHQYISDYHPEIEEEEALNEED